MAPRNQKDPVIPPHLRVYLSRGWQVFPCHSVVGGKCSCGHVECEHVGKHPRTRHGHLDATADEGKIVAWLRRWPNCNWAVATGKPSGFFALDVDGAKGRASLSELEAKNGSLPATLTARTGRHDGGEHRVFAYPQGSKMRCTTGKVGLGLDIRTDGGYILVDPSIHETGRAYEWIDSNAVIAVAPEWLIAAAVKASALPAAAGGNVKSVAPGLIPVGQRNNTLASRGGGMRRRGVDKSRICTELTRINESEFQHRLVKEEVDKVAASISRPEYDPPERVSSKLPLAEFVRAAIPKNAKEVAENPNIRTPIFPFARMMKARPECEAMNGLDAAKFLDGILAGEFGSADPWQGAFGALHNDPRAEFIRSWEEVKVPGEGDSLTAAWLRSQEFSLMPLLQYSMYYCNFISLAGHLQRDHPGQAIALPTERLGKIIGIDRTTVGLYRRFAEKAGLLTKVKPHNRELKRADEYRFKIEAFDWTTGEQLPSVATVIHDPPVQAVFPPSHGESGGSGGSEVPSESGVSGGNQGEESIPPKESNTGVGQLLEVGAKGGRAIPMPHCPQCKGHALYRQNNVGNYECFTCGLEEISEEIARRPL